MHSTPSQALLRKLVWSVRHATSSDLSGGYRSAFRGRGREFDQVVKYEFGDDIRDIDWNVTARLGEPYRKKFVEERELTVLLLFEDSLSLQFGSGQKSKRETLLEIAGLLALLSASNRDRAGSWRARPDGTWMEPPRRGRAAILRCAADLLGSPLPSLDGERKEVTIDWKLLHHALPRHSILVWLGDFPLRSEPPAWKGLRRRYEVIGIRVADPWEVELPRSRRLTTIDPRTGEILPLDTRSRATRKRHARWARERQIRWEQLFPQPCSRLCVTTEQEPIEALLGYFRMRARYARR